MGKILNNQKGNLMVGLLLVFAVMSLFVLGVLLLIAGQGAGTDASPVNAQVSDSAEPSEDQISGMPEGGEGDFGTATLQCVHIPGVSYPKTPALDRRVARRYLAVKQELESHGIRNLTANWAFRSNCQQRNVNPGGNLKARPGTSPHEAGRAIDFNGMPYGAGPIKDGHLIVQIFLKHGWTWLGRRDPPHFEIKGHMVGEPSHGAWISRIQAGFSRGEPKGCRGTDCGR
jgi:hypothetical protein